ncbi:MAG: hypothetical protein HYX63_18755 [Gammaproteobacteria bacterium]|nr:hypothetical protein [Gammaproteobacteria bacterium]
MNPFTAPLPFAARCSPWVLRGSAVLHGVGVLALAATWPFTVSLAAAVFGVGLSAFGVHRELTAAGRAFKAFVLDSQGKWLATTLAGEQYPAAGRGSPLVGALITLIPLRCRGQRYLLVLTRDMAHVDTLRRLRVRLRFESASSPTTYGAA